MKEPRGTIRSQLVALLLVVLVPLLVLFAAFLVVAWKNATEAASRATLTLARLESQRLADLVASASRMAERLAHRPEVRALRPDACGPLLDHALALEPHFEAIAVVDARGNVVCSSPAPERMPNVADLPPFRDGLIRDLSPPSDPFRSRITGRWISVVTHRLVHEGQVNGVVGVAVDLVELQQSFEALGLPPGATLTVVDGGGRVVSRVPETAEWVGRAVGERGIVSQVPGEGDGDGVVETAGLDGVRRIYAHTGVPGTSWRVYSGVPVAVAYAPVRDLTRIGIAALALAIVLAGLFAVLVVRGIERPMRRLEKSIESLPDATDRIALPDGSPSELASVVAAMNELLARRAEAERQVAEHGQLLEGILDGASDLIAVRDLEGRYLHVNQATLDWLGLPREQVVGRITSELSDDPGARRLDDEALRVIATGEPSTSEEHLYESRKDEVFVITRTPFRDETGRIVGVIVVSKDVSELRRAERERVRLANEVRRGEAVSALGALVGSVAHEVRNPLFAISSTLDAVMARFQSQKELTPFLEVLRRETSRLNAIMNELLEYGRARVEELRPDPVEPVVRSAVDLCRPQAFERRVRLDARVAPDLPHVCMDRDRLLMALRNVVDNAVRHAPPSSTVTVRAGIEPERGADIEFQVRDRGPGFAPEVLDRLFEPFITQRPGGIGLGLYLVKRVVEDHGGRVAVENALDGGGLVRLWIPLDGAQVGSSRDAVA